MNKKRFNRNSGAEKELTLGTILKRCFVFTLIFCLICSILTITLSFAFFKTPDPHSWVFTISLISPILASFITALALSKYNGSKYLLCGLLLGSMIFLLSLVLSLAFSSLEGFGILTKSAIIPSAVLGALLGIRKEKSVGKRRKKRI